MDRPGAATRAGRATSDHGGPACRLATADRLRSPACRVEDGRAPHRGSFERRAAAQTHRGVVRRRGGGDEATPTPRPQALGGALAARRGAPRGHPLPGGRGSLAAGHRAAPGASRRAGAGQRAPRGADPRRPGPVAPAHASHRSRDSRTALRGVPLSQGVCPVAPAPGVGDRGALAAGRGPARPKLRLSAPGHRSVEQAVRVEAGKVRVLQFELRPVDTPARDK
jgi:hypothetical protein